MRKFVLFLFLGVMVLFLMACGGGPGGGEPEADDAGVQEDATSGGSPVEGAASGGDTGDAAVAADPEDEEPGAPPDFALKVGDFLIEMDQDVKLVLAALGEPLGEFEAPSCAFDGIDRIFGYSDIQIHTYPVGNSDNVHTISFLNDSVRTTEGGIRLGSGLQAVLDAYGDDYVLDSGMYTYTRGKTTLEFLVEDDTVVNVIYGLIIEE